MTTNENPPVDEFFSLLQQRARYAASSPLGEASFEYFARAIGDVWTKESCDSSPPTFVCETVQYSNRKPDGSGYIGHNWELPSEGWHRVRGGNAYTFHQPATPNDVLHVDWSVESVRRVRRADGNDMVIIVSLAVYANQWGQTLAENRDTLLLMRST